MSFREEVWMCIFSAEGLGKRIVFEERCEGLVSLSLPWAASPGEVHSQSIAAECGSASPGPLHLLKKQECQWKSGVGSAGETGSGFIYSCAKLMQSSVYLQGRVMSCSEVKRSWLLNSFQWAFNTNFGVAVCRGDKEKCYLPGVDASSSAPALTQKGCDVVLTPAWGC